jgi:hypothetical protein
MTGEGQHCGDTHAVMAGDHRHRRRSADRHACHVARVSDLPYPWPLVPRHTVHGPSTGLTDAGRCVFDQFMFESSRPDSCRSREPPGARHSTAHTTLPPDDRGAHPHALAIS